MFIRFSSYNKVTSTTCYNSQAAQSRTNSDGPASLGDLAPLKQPSLFRHPPRCPEESLANKVTTCYMYWYSVLGKHMGKPNNSAFKLQPG